MPYRPSNRRRHRILGKELNITPVINIFMIIIPFLLLTTVFAKTVIIDIFLPLEAQTDVPVTTNELPEMLTINISENGFELTGIGEGVVIAASQGSFNYKQLTAELVKLKGMYPQKEEVVLLFDPYLSYDIVIKVMDAARETTEGVKQTLFPIVSLGEIEQN